MKFLPGVFDSLRTKLILLVCLSLLPSFILIYYTSQRERAELRTAAFHGALRLAKDLSARQEEIIDDARQTLLSVAQIFEYVNPLQINSLKILQEFHRRNPELVSIFMAKPDGSVMASSIAMPKKFTVADRPIYSLVTRQKEFVLGEYQMARVSGKPILSIAYPVLTKRGKIKAIYLTGLDLSRLDRFISKNELPPGSLLSIIDRNGTLLYHHPEAPELIGKKVGNLKSAREIIARQEGTLESLDEDGVERLYGFSTFGRSKGAVFVTVAIPKQETFADLDREIYTKKAWFGIVLLLALASTWLIGSHLIIRPLNNLVQAAQLIAAGQLNHRIPDSGGRGEIFILIRSFNQMADALARRLEERDKAEMNLRASEEKFSLAFRSAPLMMTFSTIDDGRFVEVNDQFLTTSGFAREEIIGRTSRELGIVTTRDREEYIGHIQQGLSVKGLEVAFQSRAGQTISCLYSGEAVRIGEERLLLSVFLDVTERREMEERLSRAEKMEALGALAGGVAHDLNNVLGGQLGYAELLLEMVPKESPWRKYLNNIMASGEKAAAIIQDMLTMTRRGVSISEVVNLNQVVTNFFVSPVYEKLMAYHPSLSFQTDLSPDLCNIKGSPVHLEKAVVNLLVNAAEAISGPGRITVQTRNCYLDKPIHGYDAVKAGDYVVLSIGDTGGGISAPDMERIFEPFYTKKKMGQSGTGLGLTIVWGTVKDHNGYIDVDSRAGSGTTFTLYFPLTREAAGAAKKLTPPEEYQGRGESILVVDDVDEQREIARGILTSLGYQVTTMASGEDAVEYLKDSHADLIVLDMIMEPGIDGLETYTRIVEFKPHQKAIVVSGYAETDRVQAAQKLGAGAYVQKPYIKEKIGLAIRAELLRQGLA